MLKLFHQQAHINEIMQDGDFSHPAQRSRSVEGQRSHVQNSSLLHISGVPGRILK